MCPTCEGTGWYFSSKAEIKRKALNGEYRIVEVEGMVVCMCPSGNAKNLAIRNHGRPQKKVGPARGY